MDNLYRKAVLAWGSALPRQLKRLNDRSDESVFYALSLVMDDFASPTLATDSRIAWALMQGREVTA